MGTIFVDNIKDNVGGKELNIGDGSLNIDSTGNVGIGVAPTTAYGKVTQIHDTGTSGANLRLTDSTSGSGTGNGFEIIQIGVNNYMINRETGFISLYTSGTEAMKIDSSGHITKPLQPAFSATNHTGQNNLSINTSVTVNYQNEIFDQNADYNISSSVFTAPVTGRYWFQASLIFGSPQTDATYIEFAIDTSNRNYSLALNDYDAFDQVTTYWAINGSCFADMDAGDTANARIYQVAGTAATDIYHSVEGARFSGYLVC